MTLGDLMINIIKKLNAYDIFGLPGDYNLRFLDYILKDKELNWVGNCNELNASYAADGYAREKGVGVLVTTLGVGELSAANGIAGSYAHNIPILHIVGYPNSVVLEHDIPAHHTLANYHRNSFLESFSPITGASTILTAYNYLDELQRVISNMLLTKKPCYIGIPADLVDLEISESVEDISFYVHNGDMHNVKYLGDQIIKRYNEAKRPLFLLGIDIARFGCRKIVTDILKNSQSKFATTLMGKSIINETNIAEPNYIGIYAGDYSTEGMVQVMQESDCIISIGTVETDLNTVGFSDDGIDLSKVITIRANSIKIGKKVYTGISFDLLLEYLRDNIKPKKEPWLKKSLIKDNHMDISKFQNSDEKLNHKDFWQLVSKTIIKEGDIILAEAGSSLFGLIHQNLPAEIDFVSQLLWASIGYTLPAAIGSAIASPKRRVLLFIGDGSFQLTAQEISLISRYDLDITIFLINNSGYTIERAIHGPKQSYNDIPMWDYIAFAKSLGITKGISIKTFGEFVSNIDNILKKVPKIVELYFDRYDYPPLLKQISEKLEKANRQKNEV